MRINTRIHAITGALLALGLGVASVLSAHAQGWPEKPIRLIAPSTPGGPPDLYGRALADQLGAALGQPLVVESMPAVGGMVAAQTVMRAPADGYTLLITTAGANAIAPNANPKAGYKAGDFTHICQGVEAALVLAANPSIGAKNFAELSRWIKSQKTPPTYSSYAPGSPAHFLGYQLSEALKTEMVHVPYKSSPNQVTDMIGGVAPLGFVQIATAAPHIKAGKLVGYATTTERRAAQLPEIPTVAEVGLPELTTSVWFGLAGPKNLPKPIVERLIQAHQKMTQSADFKNRMAGAGLTVSPDICGDKMQQKVVRDSERWARVVKATGFTAGD
ncbi:MAG TPA: tripartite tricarboxylate transporter substrate binding protein [Burkholderiales bacterium]|nr:tripartite tricarboxylate transporter substrate binding protein [Burkholderiales bacterium]